MSALFKLGLGAGLEQAGQQVCLCIGRQVHQILLDHICMRTVRMSGVENKDGRSSKEKLRQSYQHYHKQPLDPILCRWNRRSAMLSKIKVKSKTTKTLLQYVREKSSGNDGNTHQTPIVAEDYLSTRPRKTSTEIDAPYEVNPDARFSFHRQAAKHMCKMQMTVPGLWSRR